MENQYIYFHWADYTIFGAFLILFTLVGVVVSWLDRKKTSAKDFLTGGGQSHWVMVALSMQASFLSAIFILSGPGEIYNYGTTYIYICISALLALPIAVHYFLPILYRLNLISAYEYLERRFDKTTRLLVCVMFCLQIILYLSIVLYAPALALSQATGFPLLWSIMFCGGVCTTYTCMGGMKATIWNDTIQMSIIYVGLIVVVVKGVIHVGGISEMIRINNQGGRILMKEFSFNPTVRTTFWTQIIGGFILSLAPYVANQTILQKVIASKTMTLAKKSLTFSMLSSVAITIVITVFGMMTYAYFHSCDPVSSGRISKIDQIVPLLVIELMKNQPGLPGLFMATTFSAALSSMSGCLNSLSAVILTDFILPVYNTRSRIMKENVRVHLSRVFVLVFGILTIFLSYQAHFLGNSVLQMAVVVLSTASGPMLGIMSMGIFASFVNHKGASIGFIGGCLITLWIAVGALYSGVKHSVLPMRSDGCPPINITLPSQANIAETITDELISSEPMLIYKISFYYYGLFGFITTIIIGVLVSLMTGKSKNVDQTLLYKYSQQLNTDISKVTEMEQDEFLDKTSEWKEKTYLIVDINKDNDINNNNNYNNYNNNNNNNNNNNDNK